MTSSSSAVRRASGQRRRLGRLAWLTACLAIVIGAALPATGRLLDLLSVDGMPLGFYVSAQAALVLLAALLAAFAARARRVERHAAEGNQGGGYHR